MPHTSSETGARAGLRGLLAWIADTTQASRLARLSSIGLSLPRHTDPGRECWRADMGHGADPPPG